MVLNEYVMILEIAVLNIKPGKEIEFEASFNEAQNIISSMKGYKWHQLQKCIETANRYILLVQWSSIEDHTVGFRQSTAYQQWKELLHHYYDPFPIVEHYEMINQRSLK